MGIVANRPSLFCESFMKVGDLVYDCANGKIGIIVDRWGGVTHKGYRVMYDDSDIDMAYENELEVISEDK